MFHEKKAPDEPFAHAPDCKIVRSDPGVHIPWGEIRRGVWEARCLCGVQYHHEPVIDDRARLDPLDPKTARHAGRCEFNGVTEPALLRVVLRGHTQGRLRLGSSAIHATTAGQFRTTLRASGDNELPGAPRGVWAETWDALPASWEFELYSRGS